MRLIRWLARAPLVQLLLQVLMAAAVAFGLWLTPSDHHNEQVWPIRSSHLLPLLEMSVVWMIAGVAVIFLIGLMVWRLWREAK